MTMKLITMQISLYTASHRREVIMTIT